MARRSTGCRPGRPTVTPSCSRRRATPAASICGGSRSTTASGRARVTLAAADGTHASELIEGDEPSWSPDGTWLAFVAPASARDDLDVWRIDTNGRRRAQLVDDDLADEHAPRLSADGCWLFATSLLRNQMTKVVTSTLVVAPLCQK